MCRRSKWRSGTPPDDGTPSVCASRPWYPRRTLTRDGARGEGVGGQRQKMRLATLIVVTTVLMLPLGFLAPTQVAGAATVTPPDLKIEVPTNDISIGTNPATGHRQLQFTHITWDAGDRAVPDPTDVRPVHRRLELHADDLSTVRARVSGSSITRCRLGVDWGLRPAERLPVPAHEVHAQHRERRRIRGRPRCNEPEDGLLHHRRHIRRRCSRTRRIKPSRRNPTARTRQSRWASASAGATSTTRPTMASRSI